MKLAFELAESLADMTNRKSKNGFTLLELLIAMALIGLIGVLLAAIYFANFRLFSNQDVAIEVSNQSRIALDEMTNQIRQSESVFGSCGFPPGPPTDNISLKLWRIDATGDPIEEPPEDQIRYEFEASDKALTKTVNPQPGSSRKALTDKVIATNVQDLELTCDAPNPPDVKQVTIRLTTQGSTFNKTHTVVQEAKAVLRNK